MRVRVKIPEEGAHPRVTTVDGVDLTPLYLLEISELIFTLVDTLGLSFEPLEDGFVASGPRGPLARCHHVFVRRRREVIRYIAENSPIDELPWPKDRLPEDIAVYLDTGDKA